MSDTVWDNETVRGFFDENEARVGGGSSVDFMKLTSTENVFRLIPHPTQAPFQMIKRHQFSTQGRYTPTLDWQFLLDPANRAVLEAANEMGNISQEDVELAQEKGDPFTRFAVALKNAGIKTEKSFFPSTRYLWRVLALGENQIRVYDSSKTFMNQVSDLVKAGWELFHPENGCNISYRGNGQEGLARRYNSPIPEKDGSPIPLDDWEEAAREIDLVKVAARNARPWKDKARALFESNEALLSDVGITRESWDL